MDHTVELETVPRRPIAAVKFTALAAEIPQQMHEAFGAVVAYLSRAGVVPAGPAIAIYDQRKDGAFDVCAGFFVADPIEGDGHVVPVEVPAGDVAKTTHMGPYSELSRAYDAVQTWIREHGREPAGTLMWEEYFSGPDTPPEQTHTDVSWPLKPR